MVMQVDLGNFVKRRRNALIIHQKCVEAEERVSKIYL